LIVLDGTDVDVAQANLTELGTDLLDLGAERGNDRNLFQDLLCTAL